jgi:hypothetical protein
MPILADCPPWLGELTPKGEPKRELGVAGILS